MGSSHNGPSRVPHWNPWTMESLTVLSKLLLTSDGSVSSTRMLGPVESGPNAQMDLAANKSQSYLLWKNSLNFFLRFKNGKKNYSITLWKKFKISYLFQLIWTTPFSMSSANPFSSGSAIIVILFFLLGVSAKHFNDEVSTTVSQKDTTGSATKNVTKVG